MRNKPNTHVDTPAAESPVVNGVGRPSTYSAEVAARFCEKLAEGELGIAIAKLPGMPSLSSVHRWLTAHPEFRIAYEQARIMQAHAVAERAVDAGRTATPETAHAARVQFDSGRWFASKLLSRIYGDKIDANVSGEILHVTPETRRARIQHLLALQATDPKLIEVTAEDYSDAAE